MYREKESSNWNQLTSELFLQHLALIIFVGYPNQDTCVTSIDLYEQFVEVNSHLQTFFS